MTSKYDPARQVLIKAREEVLNELAVCGQNGGTGRSQNYAPVLVNIQQAIDVIEKLQSAPQKSDYDRMAAVRAAKVAKQ